MTPGQSYTIALALLAISIAGAAIFFPIAWRRVRDAIRYRRRRRQEPPERRAMRHEYRATEDLHHALTFLDLRGGPNFPSALECADSAAMNIEKAARLYARQRRQAARTAPPRDQPVVIAEREAIMHTDGAGKRHYTPALPQELPPPEPKAGRGDA